MLVGRSSGSTADIAVIGDKVHGEWRGKAMAVVLGPAVGRESVGL